MRALLRDSRDDTLVVVEATEINYDPEDSTLGVCICTGACFEIGNIQREDANYIASKAYDDGKIDLSQYSADYYDDDDDDDGGEEEDA